MTSLVEKSALIVNRILPLCFSKPCFFDLHKIIETFGMFGVRTRPRPGHSTWYSSTGYSMGTMVPVGVEPEDDAERKKQRIVWWPDQRLLCPLLGSSGNRQHVLHYLVGAAQNRTPLDQSHQHQTNACNFLEQPCDRSNNGAALVNQRHALVPGSRRCCRTSLQTSLSECGGTSSTQDLACRF